MAANNPYVRIQTQDNTLNRIQSQISAAFSSVGTGPFVGGIMLSNVSLTSGQDNLVSHKLGRIPQLWVLIGQNTNSVIWSPNSSQLSNTNQNAQFLNLQCSASCVVSLWVN